MKLTLYYIILLLPAIIYSQNTVNDSISDYIKISGDTIVRGSISLNEVLLLPKRPFKNSEEIRKYLILKRKTIKVYPYSVMASNRLNSLNERLLSIKTKRQRKRYTKMVQKFLENELTPELSKLTQSEGQILIKLIHRQTGISTYNLIKRLRNGIRAFIYNTTAKFFNMNLKVEFNPENDITDYYIEDILQRGIRDKVIEYNKPYISYDLFELKNIWAEKK
ncbi:MAG: hypothetical protein CMC69_03275 [Flavobacteriaceae bacterium]|nr:hypothetical protein [Flavobacteriaceae bacterium]